MSMWKEMFCRKSNPTVLTERLGAREEKGCLPEVTQRPGFRKEAWKGIEAY